MQVESNDYAIWFIAFLTHVFGRSECDDVCSALAAMFITSSNVYYYYSLAWHTDVVELPLIQHLNTGLETLRDTAAAAS
jgi:hypothetical protein